jgi:hypothetical protein
MTQAINVGAYDFDVALYYTTSRADIGSACPHGTIASDMLAVTLPHSFVGNCGHHRSTYHVRPKHFGRASVLINYDSVLGDN